VLIGDISESQRIISKLKIARDLDDSARARIELIRAKICYEVGDFNSRFACLQRALAFAQQALNLQLICEAQLGLLLIVSDRAGFDAAKPLIHALRTNVNALGNPAVVANLHLFIADVEGRRGFFKKASCHTEIADRILEGCQQLWLKAWASNHRLVFSTICGDLEQAKREELAARTESTRCGAVSNLRRCYGNAGRVHLMLGDAERALEYFDQSQSFVSGNSEHSDNYLSNIAKVRWLQGRFADALEILSALDATSQQFDRGGRYVYRHSLLTQAEVLARLERWGESDACFQRVLALGQQSGDAVLTTSATILRAETLLHLEDADASWNGLSSIVVSLPDLPLETLALYERVIACTLLKTGDRPAAEGHLRRAQRIYRGLRNVPAQVELSRSWDRMLAATQLTGRAIPTPADRPATGVLHNAAALMLHAGRPDLLASDVVGLLEDAACVVSAEALSRDDTGATETVSSCGVPQLAAERQSLTLGTIRQRTFSVEIQPKSDLESKAAVNSVTLLLGKVRELEQARAEREERLTLWPADEMTEEFGEIFVGGKMREVLQAAKRIAQTNIGVLITGESGTGKEVLARAIHKYSPRAQRPFVPFNCTAVPHELLESQMFGYRRGSFTGADRDYIGLIRSAKDGTLFLDEIGELGLDLQPKLLRFLESGEINPLGEPSPFTVNVRIIAATNANLALLVQQGRFREDLLYRLNALPLVVPPLRERRDEIPTFVRHFIAKASAEFQKGQIRIADETMEHLVLHAWPGNIRQLQNELRRMVAMADVDSVLRPGALVPELRLPGHQPSHSNGLDLTVSLSDKLYPTISRIEREMIQHAMKEHHGKVEAAARALGISRKGLYLKRQRLGL
jgi:transcriptional regulator with PAS, ATPase and Fis domain